MNTSFIFNSYRDLQAQIKLSNAKKGFTVVNVSTILCIQGQTVPPAVQIKATKERFLVLLYIKT